nr:hypothetical protein GCM10020093_069240 [Planobispora longispora]
MVELWDSVEPRSVAEAIDCAEAHDALRLTAVLTALDAAHMPIDITRGDRLAETGQMAAGGDERHLAEVLARQIEYATGLVLHGGDEEDADLARAVLGHLAPVTPVFGVDTLPEVTGAALCTGTLAERVDPATAQLPCDTQTDEVTTVVWHRLRPLHPARLFEAVDELATVSVRSRGRFWLATRHECMLAWDAVAGIVSVEDAGPWLAALPEAAWDMVSLPAAWPPPSTGTRSPATACSTWSSPAPTSIASASTRCSTPACSPRKKPWPATPRGPDTTTRSPTSST